MENSYSIELFLNTSTAVWERVNISVSAKTEEEAREVAQGQYTESAIITNVVLEPSTED